MPLPIVAPIIAGLVAAIGRMAATRIGQWVLSALAFLGLAWTTQTVAIEPAISQVASSMGGVSGDLAQWMGVMRLDSYVSIVLSAFTVGTVKRAILAKRGG